jgi:hypothetical protein
MLLPELEPGWLPYWLLFVSQGSPTVKIYPAMRIEDSKR